MSRPERKGLIEKAFAAVCSELAAAGSQPTLLVGDFNGDQHAFGSLNSTVQHYGFVDCWDRCNDGRPNADATTCIIDPGKPGTRRDFMLASREVSDK
eukprot:15458253-Alexandrium_andersonii.AAC.1